MVLPVSRYWSICQANVSLPFIEAFFKGVLCNFLVCLAMAAHTVAGKTVAIVFPVSAFVAAGSEHCALSTVCVE